MFLKYVCRNEKNCLGIFNNEFNVPNSNRLTQTDSIIGKESSKINSGKKKKGQ
uniref:Uncharacterized protein n=1 Tax=Rhizophora mucronata TaxID=61149 RepID=A0A2P2J9V0_RHIMU